MATQPQPHSDSLPANDCECLYKAAAAAVQDRDQDRLVLLGNRIAKEVKIEKRDRPAVIEALYEIAILLSKDPAYVQYSVSFLRALHSPFLRLPSEDRRRIGNVDELLSTILESLPTDIRPTEEAGCAIQTVQYQESTSYVSHLQTPRLDALIEQHLGFPIGTPRNCSITDPTGLSHYIKALPTKNPEVRAQVIEALAEASAPPPNLNLQPHQIYQRVLLLSLAADLCEGDIQHRALVADAFKELASSLDSYEGKDALVRSVNHLNGLHHQWRNGGPEMFRAALVDIKNGLDQENTQRTVNISHLLQTLKATL